MSHLYLNFYYINNHQRRIFKGEFKRHAGVMLIKKYSGVSEAKKHMYTKGSSHKIHKKLVEKKLARLAAF